MAEENVNVRFVEGQQRFVLDVDGTYAGVCQYREDGDTWVFTHTVVDDAFEGRGLGSALARAALDGAREHGKKIVAECPFIDAYLRKHDDWNDLIA